MGKVGFKMVGVAPFGFVLSKFIDISLIYCYVQIVCKCPRPLPTLEHHDDFFRHFSIYLIVSHIVA